MNPGFFIKIKTGDTASLVLPTCKGIELIDVNNIVRIEASSNYSRLYFLNGKTLVVAKLLRWFEDRLPAAQFIRAHRAHLLNRNFIRHINGKGNKAILYNGDHIGVSRRKRSQFLKYGWAAVPLRERSVPLA